MKDLKEVKYPLNLNAPDHFSDAEKSAWVQGFVAFQPNDPTIFNPYDGDEEPALYEAWEAGIDFAAA